MTRCTFCRGNCSGKIQIPPQDKFGIIQNPGNPLGEFPVCKTCFDHYASGDDEWLWERIREGLGLKTK